MRTIPSGELDLWTNATTDTAVRQLRVRVKRPGEVSWTNLSATLGGDWALGARVTEGTPDQPAGQFVVRFLKHATEGSVSPGLADEPINIDAALEYRPILHPGRAIEVDVRIDAEPWRLWLQGEIESVEWAGAEVVANCLTPDGVILDAQIEEEQERGAPDPGTPVEDEIQGLLDEWLADPPTLLVLGTPDWGVGEYTPPLGSLGEQIRTLAQRNGWDVRYRWSEADSDFRLTLYLPDRDKTVADFELGLELMAEVAALKVSRQYVRNAVIVQYRNSAGVEQTPVEVTDADSITEYRRRAMVIQELSDDSPIKDSTAATALADYAIADLSQPLADGRYRIPFLPWLELHDLIALQADDDHYDFDTDFAVVGISHVVEPEGGWWTEVELRGGKPAGAFYSWHARPPAPAPEPEPEPVPPEVSISLRINDTGGTASAAVNGNASVASIKIAASKFGYPSAATVRLETAKNGQVFDATAIGVLLSGLTAGELVYVSVLAYSLADALGDESVLFKAEGVYGVGATGIVDGAVIEAKLGSLSVTEAKIAASAVTTAKILDAAVNDLKLAAAAVTEAKIATSAITTTKIADDAITTPKILAGQIVAGHIAALQIQTGHLVANAVTTAKIAALAVTANEIAANAVTASKIDVGDLSAISADLGTVTAGSISGVTGTFSGDLDAPVVDVHNSMLVGSAGGTGAVFFGTNGVGSPFINNTSDNLNISCDDLSLQCAKIAFFSGLPVSKPTVAGSKGGNAALGSLLTALAGLGLITDSSS